MESSSSEVRVGRKTGSRESGAAAVGAGGGIEERIAREKRQHPCLPGMEMDSDSGVLNGSKRATASKSSRARILLFGSPREVLARISAGDPLQIRERVAAHLSSTYQLLDADRLHLRSLAHCARQALQLRASDSLEAFLRMRVADAARELLREDREGLRNDRRGASGVRNGHVGSLEELSRPLGLKPSEVREACSRFNETDAADRKACFELLVDGKEIDALAKAEGVTVTEIARRARRALESALSVLGKHQGEEPITRQRTKEISIEGQPSKRVGLGTDEQELSL